jgi:anthranilate phosphoribosyltransferase
MMQYNVAFYCSTIAETEEEALAIARQQVKDGSAYVEVDEELLEDDL